MKLKRVYKNSKFPKREYTCYEDAWDSNKSYYVYEIVGDNHGQKLSMSKAQFENFELVLRTNGWSEVTP